MPLDRVGQWSIDKLDMVSAYAHEYSKIMNSQRQKRGWPHAYHYIDGFAGPGIAVFKDDAEVSAYLMGSPLRALECEPPFDRLWFVDRSRARAALLNQNIKGLSLHERATILHGDANQRIQQLVSGLDRKDHALAFLDPYGLQVEWKTMQILANSGIVDVLVNFPLMGIIRNLKRFGGPTVTVRRILDRVMADTTWIDELYVRQGRFEDEPVPVRGVLAAEKVAEHYASDLRGIFREVSDYAIMTNSKAHRSTL
jgi:three-Cys-motif partner protein